MHLWRFLQLAFLNCKTLSILVVSLMINLVIHYTISPMKPQETPEFFAMEGIYEGRMGCYAENNKW